MKVPVANRSDFWEQIRHFTGPLPRKNTRHFWMLIVTSRSGIGIRFRSAEAPRTFSIATRIGAPLGSKWARYRTTTMGPLPIGSRSPASMQEYLAPRCAAGLADLAAHVEGLLGGLGRLTDRDVRRSEQTLTASRQATCRAAIQGTAKTYLAS